jgi:hypothetical protein
MKLHVDNGELVLEPGGWRGSSRIPLAGIDAWDLFYQLAGRRFLAFHDAGGKTYFVNLPRLSPEQRASLREALTGHLGQGPSEELLELERDNSHWAALWEVIKQVGRYLRLFINPRAPLR